MKGIANIYAVSLAEIGQNVTTLFAITCDY
jgi:hypothetical protein